MNLKWTKKIIGARTIKTGLATFLTALICQLLNLPAIFAVITSIVSIEPTAKASLKKAYVRFPASILGAFIAVMSTYFLGDSPLSYSIAATVTIFLCYKLKLYDGMLVASLTAVAMVPNIEHDYAYNFFSRLATTTIGLTTAGVVNFFVLPPKYNIQIKELLDKFEEKQLELLHYRLDDIIHQKFFSQTSVKKMEAVNQMIQKIETLLKYQNEELQYHKAKENLKLTNQLKHRLAVDRLIELHINHIVMMPDETEFSFTNDELIALKHLSEAISQLMETKKYEPYKPALSELKMSVKNLTEFDDNQMKSHFIYELLMINRLLTDHPERKQKK